ncbi:MAG: hypothetical protein ACFFGZ_14595 [Candidatus Thorarchaeota archaeon]
MRKTLVFWFLLLGVFISRNAYSKLVEADNTSITAAEDLILPLDLAPLELQKPTANVSWRTSFQSLTFKKTTIFLLELEPLPLAGYLEALDLEITINGRTTADRYETRDYAFEAPTQLGLPVDTAARKIDGSTDISILLKPQWSLLEAGVRILKAQLCSFDPRPSFGENLSRVPLIAEWNSYYLGSTPPLSVQFSTTAYLGNASGSNQLRINCYLEVLGAESPWIDLSLDEERIYQGDEANGWVNRTIAPPEQNDVQIPLTVEFHPHRSDDRHKEVTIRLEVYAVFEEFIDPREIEREEKLADIPEIPAIIANVLTLNAVLLPLLYFRKQRLAEREGRTSVSERERTMAKKRNLDFLSGKHDTERF